MPVATKLTEKVIWTVCPQGRTKSGALRVSLFVSPRLKADGTNASLKLPSTWQNWAKSLSTMTVGVKIFGSTQSLPDILKKSKPVPEVYAALFPQKTPVIDYEFTDLKDKLILSYPVKQMADLINGAYTKLALGAKDDLPKQGDLIGARWPSYLSPTEKRQMNRRGPPPRDRLIKAIREQSLEAATKTQTGLFDVFSLFHKPLLAEKMFHQHGTTENGLEDASWPGYKKPHQLSKAEAEARLREDTDFHKIAAAISNYPELARYCGLIIDLEIPFDPGFTGPLRLMADVRRNPSVSNVDTCPVTHCVLSPGRFAAVSDTTRVDDGFLILQDKPLDLIQLDVDGAAHKAVALASSLERMKASEVNDSAFDDGVPQPEATAPSLRTTGLMLAHSGRHTEVTKKASRAFDLNKAAIAPVNAPNNPVNDLTATDLMRGYRVDIIDMSQHTPKWRSLHRRNVHYTFLNGVEGGGGLGWTKSAEGTLGTSPEEEGMISTAMGSSPDGSVPDVFTLHEAMFVWHGWSLSAPEPFRVLATPGAPPPADASDEEKHKVMIGDNGADVPPGLPLSTAFTVALEPVDGTKPRGTLPALRFGHIYQTRLRTVDLTGASARWDDPSSDKTLSPPVTYRRYEPIEAPVLTLVGKVDDGDRSAHWPKVDVPLQGESMGRLALRSYANGDDGTHFPPETPKVQRNLAPPRVTQRFAETHGAVDKDGRPDAALYKLLCRQDQGFTNVDVPASDYLKPPSAAPVEHWPKPVRYSVSREQFELPYLPDPWAIGLRARLKRLGDKDWVDIPPIMFYDTINNTLGKSWPHTGPILIEGREDAAKFEFDPSRRTLVVPMPKGCRNKLRLSCILPEPALDYMALWALMQENFKYAKSVRPEDLKKMVLEGRHWMFTPWREIELIHATQKPLVVPQFIKLDIGRLDGALDATLAFGTKLSGPSTVRLDVLGSWNEPDDNTVNIDAKAHPVNRQHRDRPAQLPMARIDGFFGPITRQDIVHHFHDTRCRRVTYSMDAISRFKEFFERPLRDSEEKMKVTSAGVSKWIRSSAPPPAPAVLYVIPTFGWFRKDGAKPASRRTAGLRVYLDRPWMVTGYNEMLAVILPDEPKNPAIADDVAPNLPFVTQWGRDPLRTSAKIATDSPRRSAFKLAKTTGPIQYPGTDLPEEEGKLTGTFNTAGLKVPGQGNTTFSVAPHEVGFDPERQLWYADIAVAIPRGSYFPFIRLAVARYQPTSTPGAYLSSAVTCDFMQLSADRIAVIIPMDGIGNRYKVFLFGDQPDEPEQANRAQRGSVLIQTQVRDEHADDVLGWVDVWGEPFKKPGIPSPIEQNTAAQVDTSESQARDVADDLAGHDVSQPMGGRVFARTAEIRQASAATAAIRSGLSLIYEETFYAPVTPAGGRRRLLITESETYPKWATDKNGRAAKTTADRIVYAEGIEF